MSGTELATFDPTQLPSTQLGSDEAFEELCKGGDYLRYVQLSNGCKYCKKGLIMPGHWGVPAGEEIVDLTNSMDVLVFAKRNKAVDMTDKKNLVISYDFDSDSFQSIKAQTSEKGSACKCGPEFLIYERTTKQFYTLFLGGKSAAPKAPLIVPFMLLTQADAAKGTEKAHLALPVTLGTKFVERGDFAYYEPTVRKCSTPIEQPNGKKIQAAWALFSALKGTNAEKVAEPANARKR